MKEKHKTATDESYRDLGNLQEKLKKHQAFELELKSNNDRLNQLNEVCSLQSRMEAKFENIVKKFHRFKRGSCQLLAKVCARSTD